MQLLIATKNQGKVAEYRRLLAETASDIVGLESVGLGDMDVDETGDTFEANAIIKAQAYGRAAGLLTLADDSGLAVDALNGQPGVYSARYGGPGLDDAGRRAHLLGEMADIPEADRAARFVCVIALYDPSTDSTETVRGTCEGTILMAERDGGRGFGYDALFQPEGYSLSFAQLPPETKNSISHRGNAAAHLLPILARLIEAD